MTKKQIESVIANTKFKPQEIDEIIEDLKNYSYKLYLLDSPTATLTATLAGEEFEFSHEDCEEFIKIFENMVINADARTFEEFVKKDYCSSVLEEMAYHLDTDLEKIEILAKYGIHDTRMELIEATTNPDVDFKKLETLVKNGDVEFKMSVASRTNKPEILALLAKDISDSVREWVARNEYTPFETLENLKNDECGAVSSMAKIVLGEANLTIWSPYV